MTKYNNDKAIEKDYQTYLEHRKSCYATKNKNIEGQDKIVIAISSAVFGLLLAIFDKNMIEDNQCTETLLTFLLFSNGAALFSSLWSFFFANKAIERKMKDMESYLLFPKLYSKRTRMCL